MNLSGDGLTFAAVRRNTSVEIVGSNQGIVLESPDGSRWLVQVDNTGSLGTTEL